METFEKYKLIFKRSSRVYQILILIALIVVARIIIVQYFKKDIKSGDKIAYRVKQTEPVRGDILAKDGRLLASSIPYYKIYMDCTVSEKDTFNKYIDGLAKSLADFFKDKTSAQYKKLIVDGREKGKRYLKINNRLLDYSELAQVKQFPLFEKGGNNGGIIVEEEYRRKNPLGPPGLSGSLDRRPQDARLARRTPIIEVPGSLGAAGHLNCRLNGVWARSPANPGQASL